MIFKKKIVWCFSFLLIQSVHASDNGTEQPPLYSEAIKEVSGSAKCDAATQTDSSPRTALSKLLSKPNHVQEAQTAQNKKYVRETLQKLEQLDQASKNGDIESARAIALFAQTYAYFKTNRAKGLSLGTPRTSTRCQQLIKLKLFAIDPGPTQSGISDASIPCEIAEALLAEGVTLDKKS